MCGAAEWRACGGVRETEGGCTAGARGGACRVSGWRGQSSQNAPTIPVLRERGADEIGNGQDEQDEQD